MPPRTAPKRMSEQQAMGAALKRLRKRADLTQEKAAENYGCVVQSWRRYEWGQRDLTFDQLSGLAAAVSATREELIAEQQRILAGEFPASSPAATVTSLPPPAIRPHEGGSLPIRDRIQAGAWLLADDAATDIVRSYQGVRDPRFPYADQWYSEVVGDSVDRLKIFDGDLVHCVDIVGIGYYPKTGDVVEVERRRFQGAERELTIKQVEITPEGAVLLWPRSTNARWTEPLSVRAGTAETEEVEVRIRGLVLASIRRF